MSPVIAPRWWTDPDAGTAVLEAVAAHPGDPEQAIGAALLGYHALAQAQLVPLAATTLVDGAVLAAALGRIDLQPVAKAMAAALPHGEDAMGLATGLHEQACAATARLAAVWTSSGTPWPLALARAGAVHAVPLSHLGVYAGTPRTETTPALVTADAADRVLMGYAAQFAARHRAEPVAKSAGPGATEFDPDEHPRDEEGRFSADPTGGRRRRSARQDRQRRQVAVVRGIGARVAGAPAASSAAEQIDQLGFLARRSGAERARVARTEPDRARASRSRAERNQLAVEAEPARVTSSQTPHMLNQDIYVPLPADVDIDALLKAARFTKAGLEHLVKDTVAAYSLDAITQDYGGPSMGPAPRMLEFRFGTPAVGGGPDDHGGAVIHPDAVMAIAKDPKRLTLSNPGGHPDYPEHYGRPVEVYSVYVTNIDQLMGVPPFPVIKNFDPGEHPRAADGQFTDADVSPITRRTRSRQRRQNRQRRQVTQGRLVALAAPATTTARQQQDQLATLRRAPGERQRAARTVAQRALGRVLASGTAQEEAGASYQNHTITHAFVLTDNEFSAFVDLHPDEISETGDQLDVTPVRPSEARDLMAVDTLTTPDRALGSIMRTVAREAKDERKVDTSTGRVYPTEEVAQNEADDYAFARRRDDEYEWTATTVRSKDGSGYLAQTVGVRSAQPQTLVFGTAAATAAMIEGTPFALRRVDAADLSELFPLHEGQELADLAQVGDSPLFRAFEVTVSDDETT